MLKTRSPMVKERTSTKTATSAPGPGWNLNSMVLVLSSLVTEPTTLENGRKVFERVLEFKFMKMATFFRGIGKPIFEMAGVHFTFRTQKVSLCIKENG